jgi:hypothetical protein
MTGWETFAGALGAGTGDRGIPQKAECPLIVVTKRVAERRAQAMTEGSHRWCCGMRARRVLWVLAVGVAALVGSQRRSGAASREVYAKDLAAFFTEADEKYPFFELKGIREDWEATKKQLSQKVKTCRSDSQFLGIVSEAIRCLRDAHMWLHSEKAKPPASPTEYYPGISFLPAVEEGVVVMSAPKGYEKSLKPGTIVAEIDGEPARQYLEERAKKAWEEGGWFSSPQRARLFEYRIPLRGKKGERHRLTCLVGGKKKSGVLRSTVEARGWPHTYNLPAGLRRVGGSFHYTKLRSGAGYMYIRRVDSSAEQGIAEATRRYRDAKGWIVDLRGNGGGGYGTPLIEKIRGLPRPVAALIDAGCMSAGETLARELARFAEARLFGSRTAGSSSAKRKWGFPSGIATVTFAVRSRWRNDRKPIEFNGIEPDVGVEAVPQEVARGLNSAICRAEEYLKEAAGAKGDASP